MLRKSTRRAWLGRSFPLWSEAEAPRVAPPSDRVTLRERVAFHGHDVFDRALDLADHLAHPHLTNEQKRTLGEALVIGGVCTVAGVLSVTTDMSNTASSFEEELPTGNTVCVQREQAVRDGLQWVTPEGARVTASMPQCRSGEVRVPEMVPTTSAEEEAYRDASRIGQLAYTAKEVDAVNWAWFLGSIALVPPLRAIRAEFRDIETPRERKRIERRAEFKARRNGG